MRIYKNIQTLLTLTKVRLKDGRNITTDDLSLISNGCFVEDKGKIIWVGETKGLPAKYKKSTSINLKGKTVIPSFVECHTHSVFAGNRAHEFELRQLGVSYQEIAKQGGGIKFTVNETRKASEAQLKKLAQVAVDDFVRQGVTTLEIKSGYGLNLKEETKILKVAKSLKGPQIVTTYLGAHAVPNEHSSSESYLKEVIKDLPKIKKLANRVDMFVENGYFSIEQAKTYYEAAKKINLDCVVHADQMTRTGASLLAAKIGAISCDHAIHLTVDDIQSIAASSTTAVLLPTSDQYLKIPYPKARELLNAGARVALSTDYNPGTSPTRDLSYVGVLARLEMKMHLHEVIAAYTYNAACALGLEKSIGSLEVGKQADFIVLEDYHDLFYKVGASPVEQVYRQGKKIN